MATNQRQRRTNFRPCLEALEPRLAPATRIWDGGSSTSSNWTDRFNWDNDTLPLPNDSLVFPLVAQRKTNQVNDFPPDVTFNSLSYANSGYTVVSGNRLDLGSGGISVANLTGGFNAGSPGTITLGFPLKLSAVRTITVGSGGTLALNGTLAAAGGGFTKQGVGTLTLGGIAANNNTGTVTVNEGTLRLNKATGNKALDGTLIVGDGSGIDTVILDNNNSIEGTVTVNASGFLNLNDRTDTFGPISLNGGRIATGAGGLTAAGVLTATSTGANQFARIEGSLNAGVTFAVNDGPAATDLLISATIKGTENLIKGGTGKLELSGTNTYSGTTTVNAGVLRLSNASALGAGGTLNSGTTVAAGATLEVNGPFTFNEDLTLAGAGAADGALSSVAFGSASQSVRFTRPVTLTGNTTIATQREIRLDGVVGGNFGLTKVGGSKLTLAGVNTFTGLLTVSQGTVQANRPEALGGTTAGTTVGNGATLIASFIGNITSAEPLTLVGNGVQNLGALFSGGGAVFTGPVTLLGNTAVAAAPPDIDGNGGSLNLAGAITGNFELTARNGLVTFSGSSPNAHGLTRVELGSILTLNKAANVAAVPNNLVANGGQVAIKSPGQIPDTRAITLNAGILAVDAAETIGPLTLSGGAVLGGFPVLTLNGDITSTGDSILRGNVALGNATRTFTVTSGTLRHIGIGQTTGASALSGGVGLIKAGDGTLGLEGLNTFTGPLTVNAGTLFVGTALVSPVTVNAGATLTGNATPSIVVNAFGDSFAAITLAGGTLNPGNTLGVGGIFSGATVLGRMKANGAVTLNAASKAHFDLGGLTPVTQHDQFQLVGGSLNLGNAKLEVAFVNNFASVVGNTYTLVKNDTANPTTGFFTDAATGLVIGQGGEFFIGAQKFRMNYSGGDFNDVVLTHINTGAAFQNRRITPTINEGDTAILSGTIVEPDAADEFFLDIAWGDGRTETVHVLPGQPRTLRLPHVYAADGHYEVLLSWHDQHGEGRSGSLTLDVRNVVPRLQLDPYAVLRLDETLDRIARFVDPGADHWVATVDYGDGAVGQTLTPNEDKTFSLQHRYDGPGLYRVTVRIADDVGGTTASFLVLVL